MQRQVPKKHHFVPECYLKKFMFDDKLTTLDIRKVQKGYNEYPRYHTPAQICYYEDYYTIDNNLREGHFNLNQHEDLFIEVTALKSLEERYGHLYQSLIEKRELSRQECIDICDFIIQLKQRNPFWLDNVIEKNKDAWIEQSVNSIYEDLLTADLPFKNLPPEILEAVLINIKEKTKHHPSFGKQLQLFGLIQRHLNLDDYNELLRNALLNCEWFLMIAPDEGPYFVTTDNPGFSIGRDNIIYNTKFNDGFFFHLPLSPQYCLTLSDEFIDNNYSIGMMTKTISAGRVNREVVINTNNQSLIVLNKIIIARDRWYVDQIIPLNRPSEL